MRKCQQHPLHDPKFPNSNSYLNHDHVFRSLRLRRHFIFNSIHFWFLLFISHSNFSVKLQCSVYGACICQFPSVEFALYMCSECVMCALDTHLIIFLFYFILFYLFKNFSVHFSIQSFRNTKYEFFICSILFLLLLVVRVSFGFVVVLIAFYC